MDEYQSHIPEEAPPRRRQSDSLFDAPPMAEQERMVEAVLFASADPVTIEASPKMCEIGSTP